jgi:glc operon protein GlcG
MNGKSIALLALLALASDLAAQEPEIVPRAAPGESRPRSLLDPRGTQKRVMPPEQTTVPSDVRDTAGIFSTDAVRRARESLEKIEKSTGVPILIETIETLKGETVDEVATRLARRSGTQGVFILVARKETKIEVLASRRYAETLPRSARTKVRTAFIEAFRNVSFDQGLSRGIAAIEAELATARKEGKLPQAEKPEVRDELPRPLLPRSSARNGADSFAALRGTASEGPPGQIKPLVIRNQVRLTLEGARTIIVAATEQAATMNIKVNIAVVDDGGHLLSFDRMNGARPASGYTAITKATTAATFRQPTGPLPAGTTNPDPLLNLSLQIAAQSSGGKITTLSGGVPVVVDGQVIGAVGVGGGSGEQDAQVARAGIQALLSELQKQEPRS